MSKERPSDRCPVCGKPTHPKHAPFCSQGCRDRDLLRWLGEGYRIPGPPATEDDIALDKDDKASL